MSKVMLEFDLSDQVEANLMQLTGKTTPSAALHAKVALMLGSLDRPLYEGDDGYPTEAERQRMQREYGMPDSEFRPTRSLFPGL